MRNWGWSGVGLAFVGGLLLLAPVAGATSPPVTMVASYAHYGGLADVGHSSATATGHGSNTIGVAPAFAVATGIDRQGQLSLASRSGTYGIDVHSGAYNLSFTCPAACANGTAIVTVAWNTSWYVHLNTSCPGNASGTIVYAAVALGVIATVFDVTTSTTAGTISLTLYSHLLYASGVATAGKTGHVYLLKFSTTLTSGDSYTILTQFQAYTYAHAAAFPGAVCGSGAQARVGVAHATTLKYVRVP